MVEAEAKGLSEDEMLGAIEFAQGFISEICDMIDDLREKVGQEKLEFMTPVVNEELYGQIESEYWDELKEVILTPGKFAQKDAINAMRTRVVEKGLADVAEDDPDRVAREKELKGLFSKLVSARTRRLVLDEDLRADGRGLRDVRPISIHLGVLPRVHGSAVFTRGETQSLASMTLGTQRDEQRVDGLVEPYSKRFYLDYNFPPFSVGECKPIRGPGRREIGHGMLAERALAPVLPNS